MEDLCFIFVSSKPWYSPLGGTAKSLAFELGKRHRTYYVNAPLDRKTILKEKNDPSVQQHLQQVASGQQLVPVDNLLFQYYTSAVLESVNWIPSTPLFKWLTRINNKRLAKELKQLLQKEQITRFVLINDKDIFRGFYLDELMQPALYAYLDRDYVLGVPYWARHGMQMEPELMAKSDLVMCNSMLFTETALKYNQHSHFVGNGCDIDLFNGADNLPVPEELAGLPRPLIGYAGALVEHRLDIALLEEVARNSPQYSFVLIGKEDEAFTKSKLHQMPNVHFLGPKPSASLPAYYAAMDVCINPQLVNNITEGNYPMKIDEYLAMGKPVVAMQTHAMQYFAGHTLLATDASSFARLLATAMESNSPEKRAARIEFAREHSWPKFTGRVLDLIHQRLNELS